MSWSVNAAGDTEMIGEAFDAERDRAASAGMIEAEQMDIDEARNLTLRLAVAHGNVRVSASGHWTTVATTGTPEQAAFARMSITIEKAPY